MRRKTIIQYLVLSSILILLDHPLVMSQPNSYELALEQAIADAESNLNQRNSAEIQEFVAIEEGNPYERSEISEPPSPSEPVEPPPEPVYHSEPVNYPEPIRNPPSFPTSESTTDRAVLLDPLNPSDDVPPPNRLKRANPIMLDVLNFRNVDISDVLKLISEKSGLNIVAGRNVTGQISLYLKNVEVFDALRIILEANDLAYLEQDGIVRILTKAEYEQLYGTTFNETMKTKIIALKYISANEIAVVLNQMKGMAGKIVVDEKSNTLVVSDTEDTIASISKFVASVDLPRKAEVFNLSYSKADEVAEKISGILTPNGGIVKSDLRSNRIVVYDTVHKIDAIKEVIEAFDVKESEVLIEAKIVQIVLSDETKLGINWQAIVNDYHGLNAKNDFSILGAAEKGGRLGIGTLATDDYTVLVEALNSLGSTNILSNPHITAVNNKEAKILVGSTEPYVTSTTTTPSSGPATTAESVNFIEVGIKLYVTPTIHNDGFITMKIKPEVSSVTRSITTSNNNTIPVVDTSEAETTVSVKDGVTIVIGGLIKDENIETINRVPVLGSIPLLNYFFQNKRDLLRKTELVIFLTPRIVTGDRPMEEEADENIASFTELPPNDEAPTTNF